MLEFSPTRQFKGDGCIEVGDGYNEAGDGCIEAGDGCNETGDGCNEAGDGCKEAGGPPGLRPKNTSQFSLTEEADPLGMIEPFEAYNRPFIPIRPHS